MRNTTTQRYARHLRKHLTNAEQHLWRFLRRRQLFGARFRRQLPIGPYIVDFACMEQRLIIELDGGQHQCTEEYDRKRTRYLESCGYRVIRFWNNDVLTQTESVLSVIADAIKSPHPNPPPLAGEGAGRSAR